MINAERTTDFSAVDAVVDATHRYHEIFYDKQWWAWSHSTSAMWLPKWRSDLRDCRGKEDWMNSSCIFAAPYPGAYLVWHVDTHWRSTPALYNDHALITIYMNRKKLAPCQWSVFILCSISRLYKQQNQNGRIADRGSSSDECLSL